MTSLIAALVAIAFVAIPIAIVWKVARRLQQVRREFSDPAKLRRAFAEHAASALRRAGAAPQSVAKLEVLAQQPGLPRRPAMRRPQRHRPTPAPIAGLDTGESFRLSQPPDHGEPHVPFAISNWIAVALFAGAAAYWFLR
jgi:hypothetical protein